MPTDAPHSPLSRIALALSFAAALGFQPAGTAAPIAVDARAPSPAREPADSPATPAAAFEGAVDVQLATVEVIVEDEPEPELLRELGLDPRRDTIYGLYDGMADAIGFAAGDFNTTSAEDASEAMLDRFVRPDWTVVHEQNCRDRAGNCRGTSYYARVGSWSYLDMILWSPARERGAQATWALRENSVRIANGTAAQLAEDGTPARFTVLGGRGVSDHWPLHFSIESK